MRFLSLISFLIAIAPTMAQGPANNWYFGGGAGINFNTSPPTVLENGRLNTLEGSASISNDEGQLLFYTDGSTVYNRNSEIMENGTGLFGDQSSTQSAIIIPKPLNPEIYYIFTVDVLRQSQEGVLSSFGVNYSVVDFSENPNGIITSKNINLLAYSGEKLSAVIKGCDSDTVWMVTQSSANAQVPNQNLAVNLNTFYAFAVTPGGVSNSPVISTVSMNVNDPRGNLKFSPNGKKLASANTSSGLYLLNFDSETGQVSAPLPINSNTGNDAAYGVEFSPDNRFLYVHSSNNANINLPPPNHFSTLYQYDLEATSIVSSQVVLDEQNYFRGSLQLGPDGKIYRALSAGYQLGLPFLGVIENPNSQGVAASYRDRAINLGNAVSFQGLPPFNQSLFNKIDIIGNNLSNTQLDLCSDETYTLQYDDVQGADYTWYKNNILIPGQTGSRLQVRAPTGALLPVTEVYELILNLNDGSCEKVGTAEVTFYPYPNQPTSALQLVQCENAETANGFSTFNLEQLVPELTGNNEVFSVSFYESAANANAKTDAVEPFGYENLTPTQKLFARVSSPANCAIIVPFNLIVSSTIANNSLIELCDENDTGFTAFDLTMANAQLLQGQSPAIDISYYLSREAALLEDVEFRLEDTYENEIAYSQFIFARLENNNACFAISEVELRVNQRPQFELPGEIIYCANTFPQTITVMPQFSLDPLRAYTYEWLPEGQTTMELETNRTGQHTLTVTDVETGCTRIEGLTILEKDLAVFENIAVVDASQNNSAVINVTGNGSYEFSLSQNGPFQVSNEFTNLEPGFYTAYVQSNEGCGVVQQGFSVIGFPPFFTPNGDGFNDLWQVKGINDMIQPGTSIHIFDRYGKLIKELNPLSGGWDGTFNGAPLPTDDYWFSIVLQDGREFKANFTLKR